MRERVHIKLGSDCVANKDGLNAQRMSGCAEQVAELSKIYRVSMTSSGAVAKAKKIYGEMGKSWESVNPRTLAAVGSAGIVEDWRAVFRPFDINVGQVPVTHLGILDKKQGSKLLEAYEELEADDIIPIGNNNDVLTHGDEHDELAALEREADNDWLASDVARLLGVEAVLFCLPKRQGLEIDGIVQHVVQSTEIPGLEHHLEETSSGGTGGMGSKLRAAAHAAETGIAAYICNIEASYQEILAGNQIGTQVIQ